MNFDFIKKKMPDMVKIAYQSIEKIREEKSSQNDEHYKVYKVELKKYFEDIVSDIVVKLFFGADHH